MSRAPARLYASACALALAWLFAMIIIDGHVTPLATAAGAALALAALVGLHAVNALQSPRQTPALVAIHRHDSDRRRSVVRLADPDASGRRRPRAPGHPYAG